MRLRIPTPVVLTVALVLASATHAAEDYQFGEFARFGVAPTIAGLAQGTVYAGQLLGVFLVGRGSRTGAAILAVAGVIWCVGALLIHGSEIIAIAPYRHGLISKALEGAVIVLGAAAALASGSLLASNRGTP